jgi:putative ABC transport system permease protein
MGSLWQELRYGVRALVHEPGWTAVAVLTLALGIGANAAMFSVVDHALLRPLPFPEAERLVAVWGVEAGTGLERHFTSYPDLLDFQREATRSFEGFAAYRGLDLTLTAPDTEPARVEAAAVSRELFPLLRASTTVGRTFAVEDDRPGAPGTVVLSESLWRERWGGRADLLGQTVMLDGRPHAVVGVMPAAFHFPPEARLWVAAGPQPRNEFRGVHAYRIVARLRPEAALAQAGAELGEVSGRLAQAYPEDNAGRTARAEPLQASVVGRARPALVMLLGAVVLVLLITCANLAALLVARGTRRARELAVRVSLGASRARLVRQLLTETALVATLGAAAALALAAWLVPILVSLAPPDLPRLAEVAFDPRVAVVCLAVTVLTACVFGVAPALVATRVHPATILRSESGRASAGPARQHLRQALTLGQTALAVVLLTGAGLLLRSLSALTHVEPGFRTEGVLAAEVQLPEARYATWREQSGFYETLLARVRALPGVEAAAVASGDPFDGGFGARFGIEGRPPFPKGKEPEPAVRVITPGYLSATGVRLRRGRDLAATDRAGAPGVVLINDAMAARFFPGEDPLGHRVLRRWWAPEMPQAWEIVGVVADVKTESLEGPPDAAIYYPAGQITFAGMTLIARTGRDPLSLTRELREAVRGLDPELPLSRVRSMDQVLTASLGARRFNALVLGLFAGLALLLAAIGIYGVLAYAVAQRGHEIAVRLALGAARGDVVSLVTRQAALLAGVGLAAGMAGALALSHVLRGMLFEVRPLDPLTLAAVVAAVGVTTAVASLAPLRRALTVDPAAALRGE